MQESLRLKNYVKSKSLWLYFLYYKYCKKLFIVKNLLYHSLINGVCVVNREAFNQNCQSSLQ